MAHPDVTVLLARQRSGTNAVLSVLGTHPEIFCFDEVFRRDDLIPGSTSPPPSSTARLSRNSQRSR